MKAALYARVSTDEQNPQMQLRELREYAERRGWQIVGEFVDWGASRAKESRPELNKLMIAAKQRRFDIVAVWKFDRYARSLSHMIRSVETFKHFGIQIFSYTEQFGTTPPHGEYMFAMNAAYAQLERSMIVERVRAGLRNARANRRKLGRKPRDVDPEKVAELRAKGFTWAKIAETLMIGYE
jgi:DNA invertase Pin-like site-specific DNA recombinase